MTRIDRRSRASLAVILGVAATLALIAASVPITAGGAASARRARGSRGSLGMRVAHGQRWGCPLEPVGAVSAWE